MTYPEFNILLLARELYKTVQEMAGILKEVEFNELDISTRQRYYIRASEILEHLIKK